MAEAAKQRIVFMGTPDFGAIILKKLLQTKGVEIAAVFTQPDRKAGRGMKLTHSPVKEVALQHNLPLFQPETLKKRESIAILEELAPDIIVVASYGLILPPEALALAPCLNVHASLLPRWRGAAPVQRALQESWLPDAKTGISIMKMEKGLDTGAVYCMAATSSSGKSWQALDQELAEMGGEALLEVMANLERLQPVEQDESLATYAPKLVKQDGGIDWHDNAEKIEAQIRAMNPWPGASAVFEINGNEVAVNIMASEVADCSKKPLPGEILLQSGKIFVGCGEGWLSLLSLKPGGRKAMDAKSFANGYLGKNANAKARLPETK